MPTVAPFNPSLLLSMPRRGPRRFQAEASEARHPLVMSSQSPIIKGVL
jgi:hypothetical protein